MANLVKKSKNKKVTQNKNWNCFRLEGCRATLKSCIPAGTHQLHREMLETNIDHLVDHLKERLK
jgi:hypothetical protein